MAEMLTPAQKMAVENRGGKLLISAAAGSGKTKVLVDRLLSYILDPIQPANIDDFLMITYTKAAASELRGKIVNKLTERLAEQPENRHLQRQMQRLYLTKISTVHSFCADILREYAYCVDIAADFRVADENECSALRETVMTRMLERAYESAQDDPDFRAFVDAQGLGRDDRLVPEILLKVFDSARCHLDPHGWLDGCVERVQVEDLTDAAQTPWGRALMEELFGYLDLQIRAMERCAGLLEEAEGCAKQATLLRDTVVQLQHLRDSRTWDQVMARKNVEYGTLRFPTKFGDLTLKAQISAVRNGCKKGLEKKLKNFTDSSDVVLEDLRSTASAVRGVAALVRRFEKEFDQAKRSRRILDFGDLEHRMLDLLLGRSRSGQTAVAREIGTRFLEIMVDEYQDSNAVQDAIYEALTRQRGNCFMVGDVKQSIYQFRLADPGIFLEKYNQYAHASQAQDGEGRKIMLSENFRSGGAVLKSVNDIFELCMSPAVGGLHYGEQEALREGIPHEPLGEPEVELWAVDVREDTYREEARFVAQRIRELTDGTHFVRSKQGLKPIGPEDVAILLRSPGSIGGHYVRALAQQGIRAATGGGEDLLQMPEIATLRSVLQAISNPRQDIPLVAALASPVFGFTADELAGLRAGNKGCCFYEALCRSSLPKAVAFVETLSILRREARLRSLPRLIELVFILTGMDSVYAAMADGKARTERLQVFYELAAGYEGQDLDRFLEHLQAMEAKGLIMAGEQASDAVTIMSIHKSKGLEFPVVFVCGLSRSFNTESARGQVLCDQDLGLGLSVVDTRNRLRYPTLAKRAIASKVLSDGLSEELRVLYVALTRACDRLIMTYASDSLEKDLTEMVARMDLCDPALLSKDVVCPGEWVLMTALKRTEAGALFELGGHPGETRLGEPVWKIGVVREKEEGTGTAASDAVDGFLPTGTLERLRKGLAFRYGHEGATMAPSKQTATQRKGRQKDAEAAENTEEKKVTARTWRRPGFSEQTVDGVLRGNAYHGVMQYIRFACCGDEDGVRGELVRLEAEGFLTAEQIGAVDHRQIAAFFRSPLGKRLLNGAKVLREFKFSILDEGENFDPALVGEKILMQGVVDCAIVDEDGLIIIDFKTDRVTDETLPQRVEDYRPQVETYRDAMERIFEKKVKQTVLYFFSMDRFVEIL